MRHSDPRVLELYARREAGGRYRAGTGYLLDNGLILTAAHVLADATGTIIVRRRGDSTDWHCAVVWRRHDTDHDFDGVQVDAALLRVVSRGWTGLAESPPLSWGRLVTDQPAVPVVVAGFPAGMAARHDDGRLVLRDIAHGSGFLNTRAGPDGHLLVTLTQPIPALPQQGLRWQGTSGAAVLVSGSVMGIVVAEVGSDGRGLAVLPVTELARDTGFREHIGQVTFLPAELRPVLTAGGPRRAYSPVSLLAAEAEAVRFHGRDALVNELTSWCHDDTWFSVRLISGSGGQGKTRLARHLTALMRERGWSTGFLGDRISGEQLSVLGRVTTPLLLVVDYVEDRTEQLVELATRLGHTATGRGSPPIRLLLLARAAGEWWDRLRRDAPLLRELSTRIVIPLPELEPTPTARLTALDAVIADLGSRLGEVAGYTAFDPAAAHEIVLPDVSGDRFGCALNLHMAALVALLQTADPVATGKDEDDEAVLLRHEQKFWKRTATGFGLDDLNLAARRQLVGVATLCQADNRDEAHAILDRLDVTAGGPPGFRDRVADWLASLYPAEKAYWGPLHPDRLGEYLVSVVTDTFSDLLARVVPNVSRPQALRALRTLARADIHRPGMAAKLRRLVAGHADPLAFTAVEAATTVEHPDPLRQALADVSRGADLRILFQLYDTTPLQSQALDQWATGLADRLTSEARIAVADSPARDRLSELAKRLNNHAIRLAAAGRHTEALDASRESVALRRQLAQDGTPAGLHDLALSLNTHVGSLTDTGHLPEAMTVAEEVVRLCRETTEEDPADLPMALYSLAIRQRDLGYRTKAVDTAEEALRLYRELADDDRATYLPDVALALSLNAINLTDAARFEPAVIAAAQAVTLYRELAAESPDAYAADVARALSYQATALNGLGQHDEAVEVAAESVRLFRNVMAGAPTTDPVWLSLALDTYGKCLSDVDEDDEATVVCGEALAITRRLYESTPAAYVSEYARALRNHARVLLFVGRATEAVPLCKEAVSLYRPLVEALPLAHDEQLSLALNTLAEGLRELDELEPALTAAGESVATFRRLAEHDPDAHLESLIASLRVRVEILRAVGRHSLALESLDEAISLQRPLVEPCTDEGLATLANLLDERVDLLAEAGHRSAAADAAEENVAILRRLDGEEHQPVLARSLNRCAIMLSDAGRGDEMVSVVEQALGLWRTLADGDPDGFRSDVSVALHLRAVGLSQTGRMDEALIAADENVRLLDKPARDDPDTYLPMLVGALADHAVLLVEAARASQALATADEALTLGTDHDEFASDPGFASDLARAKEARARALSMLARHDEALRAAEDGLLAWQELADVDPTVHLPSLASMYHTQAELLATAGRPDAARTAADTAVELFTRLAAAEPDAFAADLKQALATQREVGDGH